MLVWWWRNSIPHINEPEEKENKQFKAFASQQSSPAHTSPARRPKLNTATNYSNHISFNINKIII